MERSYEMICELCEREVVYDSNTGDTLDNEECKDLSCPMLLSSTREDGDPLPLDFNEEGC